MPDFEIGATTFDISRDAVILDSNLLIEAFLTNSPRKTESLYFLEQFPHQWVIPIGVVVETWGFIVGKNDDWIGGGNFLSWINTPSTNIVVIGHDGVLVDERNFIDSLQIDCVDSMIVTLATRIFHTCNFGSPVPIATWDTRDFYRLGGRQDIRIQVYDLNEALIQDLS